MIKAFFYETKIGKVAIGEDGQAITNLFFEGTAEPKEYVLEETDLIKEAAKQLNEYFEGKRKSFELPLSPKGTDFEKEVYGALLNVRYGETKSYGDIAREISRPKAVRAVGMANSKNPIAIFIPCHRVIGKNGNLTGYAGGLHVKELLLELEKNTN